MNSASKGQRKAWLALALTVIVWAYSWIVMKQAMAHAGPFDFVALRFALGAAVLFAAMAALRQPLRPPPLGLTLAIGLCQTTAFQGLSQWALVSGGAGRVSLLAYTMPFWSVLFAWRLLHLRPGARHWLGIALAICGLTLVIEPWHGLGSWQSTALALASGGLWGLGTALSKRMFEQHHPSALSLTAWQMLLGGAVLGVVALLVPQRPIEWTGALTAELLYAAVLASSLGWLLWLFVVERLPATVASLSSLVVPVTVILMAWALLGERPDAIEAGGIVLIILGLVATSSIGVHRMPPAP